MHSPTLAPALGQHYDGLRGVLTGLGGTSRYRAILVHRLIIRRTSAPAARSPLKAAGLFLIDGLAGAGQ
jgi:hypothetical protein